ncbi:DUF3298 domain-containing protein [Formosa sp. PL04]|uniref:DUF3298 domain-containing protein n=1 Tax=Formosa sp. PL04 TaxID=3081755 RepID=UPI002980B8C4|nr:DUF3298 domain-containing protein [Formosa sp. PL04]MDW5290879.1 DUF3298 domain-containing protein [Formosa sp. PL04]
MKYIYFIILVLIFTNCKNDKRQDSRNEIQKIQQITPIIEDPIQTLDADIEKLDKAISIEIKQKELIKKKDRRGEFQKLIIGKKYVTNSKDYTINFNYPLLDESLNASNVNFNDFITNYYVNVAKTISEIQESKLLCDSITAKNFREERFIDYKIYVVNDILVSVLFYKENFYSGAMHPSYTFDCFNFNLNNGAFMSYEDFFIQGSENELLAIINKKIKSEALYSDCWELSSSDFFESKNNFVLNETYLEFYFDDCVMCPSYTGTYSIKLPLVDILIVLKKSNSYPVVI